VLWALFLLPRVGVLLVDVVPTSDAAWYFGRAAELAAGLGYLDKGEPTAFWPPGWPLALSAVFRLTGPSVLAVGLFNLACAAATAWFTLALGRRLFASEAAARTGLLLLAVYPNSIGYVPLALTEVFYTALLMAGCWLFVTRKSAWMLIPVGAIFGFATLVKAQTLVVVPVLFAIEWLRAPDIWRRMPALVLQGALVLAVAALTVLPWTVRNHQQVGHWVAVSANGGFTLLTGNNDSATGDYTPDDPTVAALMARPGLDEVARDAEARRLAMAWIEVHPGKFLALMPQKLARLWLPDGEAEWAYQGGHPLCQPGLLRLADARLRGGVRGHGAPAGACRRTVDRLVAAALWRGCLSLPGRSGLLRPVALPLSGDALRLPHGRLADRRRLAQGR
jgi:hypothetical protein